MMHALSFKLTTFFVLLHLAAANSLIDRDFYGFFTLEQGTSPLCLKSLTTNAQYNDTTKFSSAYFSSSVRRYYSGDRNVYCRPNTTRRPGHSNEFFDYPSAPVIKSTSSIREVLTTEVDFTCTGMENFNSSLEPSLEPSFEPDMFVSPEPFPSNTSFGSHRQQSVTLNFPNVKFIARWPSQPVTYKGLRLVPEKRYVYVEYGPEQCVYSAAPLKRLLVQGTYNLVRSPLLKTPPSYCKSKLTIGGTLGSLDASEMLFDGRADTCLKGRLSLVQEFNIKFPVVTKLVQDAIPYYGFSPTPLRCGNSTIYVGAVEISRDGALGNVLTVKGAKYFGMVSIPSQPPYLGTDELLSKVGICLYTSVGGNNGGFWSGLRSALG